ncbi:uncharacterized protein BDR25DRAFT_307678 [Lindgomyces ingoldianus]|uniref:Uncharacterized protein n=1 Tax=Lindgomyces ingoldianus TaxID=673940 RepID=A0ACB6Q9E1_9PLEO|nr:uncharacterized protein BDR25DRAFT_307678 [Lindgomyces ingoldianus]KAF2463649.1 hypothetical protein BDR25DRAFT_307678 [Lindgomyces ingoldianus]
MTDDHKMEDAEMSNAPTGAVDKGKGKAPQAPDAMEESAEESSSGEESGAENEGGEPELEDEDNMEEIDTSNIIPSGRRTRGKNIDFKKAAQELGGDDDEEDDEDFNDPDDAMEE